MKRIKSVPLVRCDKYWSSETCIPLSRCYTCPEYRGTLREKVLCSADGSVEPSVIVVYPGIQKSLDNMLGDNVRVLLSDFQLYVRGVIALTNDDRIAVIPRKRDSSIVQCLPYSIFGSTSSACLKKLDDRLSASHLFLRRRIPTGRIGKAGASAGPSRHQGHGPCHWRRV